MLTGRYAFRTGWGFGTSWLNSAESEFPTNVVSLPSVLGASYDTTAIGNSEVGTASSPRLRASRVVMPDGSRRA